MHPHTIFLPRQFNTSVESCGNSKDTCRSPSFLEKAEVNVGMALILHARGYCGMKMHADQKFELRTTGLLNVRKLGHLLLSGLRNTVLGRTLPSLIVGMLYTTVTARSPGLIVALTN